MWRLSAALVVPLLNTLLSAADSAQYVNPFIGTKNGGHVFSGATLPFGSVKAGADSVSSDNQGGYVSDGSKISGISQLHDDGTGGGSSLGNFPLLPLTSGECAGNDLSKCTVDPTNRALAHSDPTGSPGYFSIPLANGVNSEVTVTQHTTLHRFAYPANATQLTLLADVTTDLGKSFQGSDTISVSKSTNGTRITGGGQFVPSFGEGTYKVYFCLDTQAYDEAILSRNGQSTNITGDLTQAIYSGDVPAAVLLGFNSSGASQNLTVRVGISWTSTDKACAYAQEEIPDLTAFDQVQAAARAKWNEILGTVEVDATGVSDDVQQLFWSSLYRAYISPTNITGDNPLWESSEPYWDSFYCIWDSFRDVHPLWSITSPIAQAEVIRALIDVYRQTGWLPDCRMSLTKGFTQGGSNADSLLSDSFVKGISAGIDWETGYQAVVKDATVEGDFSVQGRGGIAARQAHGYVPVGDSTDNPTNEGPNTRSASRLLEYAYNDFSIALIAKGLGNKGTDYDDYVKKSGDWFNIWNPNATNSGYSGFIQPKDSSGNWYLDSRWDNGSVFRPDHCSPVYGHNDCFLNPTGGEFYEASSWEYSFYVPHDMNRLVGLMGGPEKFSARLDTFFADGFHDIGDEPGFLPTYLYNYAGMPSKTVDRVEAILNQYFNTSVNGLPGNDDSGAMGVYAVWSYLGFYPVAGQDTYLLSRPFFPTITFHNQVTGATTTITSTNFSDQNKYIQSATLNGQAYTKNWISHDIFTHGGILDLVMGPTSSSTWGTGSGDLPPSISTGGFQ